MHFLGKSLHKFSFITNFNNYKHTYLPEIIGWSTQPKYISTHIDYDLCMADFEDLTEG